MAEAQKKESAPNVRIEEAKALARKILDARTSEKEGIQGLHTLEARARQERAEANTARTQAEKDAERARLSAEKARVEEGEAAAFEAEVKRVREELGIGAAGKPVEAPKPQPEPVVAPKPTNISPIRPAAQPVRRGWLK